jgi:hypothetical protein
VYRGVVLPMIFRSPWSTACQAGSISSVAIHILEFEIAGLYPAAAVGENALSGVRAMSAESTKKPSVVKPHRSPMFCPT